MLNVSIFHLFITEGGNKPMLCSEERIVIIHLVGSLGYL